MPQPSMLTKHSAGSASARLVAVNPELVATVWPQVRHYIERAYEQGGDDSIELTEEKVLSGKALLWVAFDERFLAAGVTQIFNEARNRVCLILACGGEKLALWQSQMSVIEDYARSMNCSCVRFQGRRGWKRIFRDFNEPWITLEKRL